MGGQGPRRERFLRLGPILLFGPAEPSSRPGPHAVSADVSSGGQERARIARPQGLVLDGHEDGGTIAANEARGEGPMRDIDLFQLALGLVPPWMVVDAKFDADQK